jgi:hypothetical protein
MPAKTKRVKRRSLKPTYGSLDVREPNDVPALESLLKKGPITFVLVYADWCGHCKTYKENTWKNLQGVENKKNNLASVHYDQLENTSLKQSKIDGYPSLLVVGTDGKPATFKTEEGTTNAMPELRNENLLKTLLTKPASPLGEPMPSLTRTPMNAENNLFESAPESTPTLYDIKEETPENSLMSTPKAITPFNMETTTENPELDANQGEPMNLLNTLGAEPPNPAEDLIQSQPSSLETPLPQRGGAGLMASLMKFTKSSKRRAGKRRTQKKRSRRLRR